MSSLPLLVIQHQDTCTLAAFDDWLRTAGVSASVVRPYAGDSLPRDLAGCSGVLVLGGSAGPNDDAAWPWLPGVRALLRLAVADGVPVLGICLGHQLLAAACGGVVERSSFGRRMGVFALELTPEAADDPVVGALAQGARAVRSHQDVVVALPPGAAPLAWADGVNYAFRLGANAWGVQFHPEVTAAVVADWATRLSATYREAGEDRDAELGAAAAEVRAAEPELLDGTGRPLALAFAERLRAT
ncbi:type 1 glutamine amidotransferase [Flindersiella endophytica]